MVLITGGTGSFGKECVRQLLNTGVKKVIVLSRDELKQHEMRQEFKDDRLRFFLGDVRDRDRLSRAFYGVTTVIHAAALKQVPASEYNPFEFIKTNVYGSQNVVEAALDCGVKKVICLSTDKACNPVNLYGATKLCMEKLFISGNAYAGNRQTRFSVVRYGNVWGSRGSVVELFKKQADAGVVTVTDPTMTRFWIHLPDAVRFVLGMLKKMKGGEIFVPKMMRISIGEVAERVAPWANVKHIGIRPGEKMHETVITKEEGSRTYHCGDYYLIAPEYKWRGGIVYGDEFSLVPQGFEYRSDSR